MALVSNHNISHDNFGPGIPLTLQHHGIPAPRLLLKYYGFIPPVLHSFLFLLGDVRLVPRGSREGLWGRVEVLHDGVWGTVCDDGFTDEDAKVVCRQMGASFGRMDSGLEALYYGDNPPIWMDEVTCLGTESSLTECEHLGWGEHNCGHFEDIIVECGEYGVFSLS